MFTVIFYYYIVVQENGNLQCGKKFSNICLQVSEHLSKTILQDVSVAICFVFLLHLANEKVR